MGLDEQDRGERDRSEQQERDEQDQNALVPHKPRRDMVAFHASLLKTVVKLFIASLLVGLVMHWFGVTPLSLIANFGTTVERAFDTLVSFSGWAINYILAGAVIVVPIWLLLFFLDKAKRDRGS